QSCGGSAGGGWLSATFSDAYDWDNILNSYGGNQTQRDAVAELCYEGGVAVAMDYGYCGSGSYHSRVLTAMPTYFGYSSSIDEEHRSDYNENTWFSMLQDELDLSRPMQYGIDAHSIVCDGWRVSGTNQIHLNYGWGGPYTGWYTIDNVYLGGYWIESTIRRIIGTPFLTLTSPNGGQTWCVNADKNITWSGAGFSGNVTISLDRNYPSGSWENLFSGTPHDGVQTWEVSGPATTNARIRIISDSEPSLGDTMDGSFTISDPYIYLSSPNGGEAWYVSQSQTIYWSSCSVEGNVDITINRDYPTGDWDPLFTNTDNDGYEAWIVSEPTTNHARIRVVSVDDPSIRDSSAGDFTIGSRYVALTVPVGGETWYVGDDDTIRWTSENVSGTVSLSLSRNSLNGPWENVAVNTANDGEHVWEVTIPTTTNARVRIIADSYSGIGDTSAANFTVTDVGDITVTSPNGSEVWIAGNPEDITWTSGGVSGTVKIELDRDYPSSWETLYASTTNDGIQSWNVTGPVTTQARIQISSVSVPAVLDVSDADFSIEEDDPPVIAHDPKDDGEPGSVLFVAGVFDELPGVTTRLFYRLEGAGSYDSTEMSSTGNPDEYAASVSLWTDGSYEYYVKAYDVGGQASVTSVYDFQLYPLCTVALYYDDGSTDRANWAGDTRFRWAVKFTPLTTPYTLCGGSFAVARVKPDSAHQQVRVEVYDNDGPSGMPGTVLFDEVTGSAGNEVGGLPPGQTYWATVQIRDAYDEPLVLYDDFYIAVSNPDSSGYEAFARDTTGTIADRSYLYDGCLEQWYAENDAWENCKDGNRIIRALGYYQEPPVVVLLRSGDDAELHWDPTGASYYRVYSDVTAFGSYTTFEGSTSDTSFTDTDAVTGSTLKFYRVMSSTQP
ncbi:C10 family peptidase, partial [bacterium]|nr:C10 family peptidase [bacterium]